MAVIIFNCVRSGFWIIFIFLVDILICVSVVQMQNKYFKQAVRVSKRDLVRFQAKAKRRCSPAAVMEFRAFLEGTGTLPCQ